MKTVHNNNFYYISVLLYKTPIVTTEIPKITFVLGFSGLLYTTNAMSVLLHHVCLGDLC